MLMADTMAIFLVIVGLLISFSGLWLLCRGLWFKRVEAAAIWCGKSLWKPFLVGLPLSFITVLFTILFKQIPGPVGNVIAIGIVCSYLMYASVGASGLATSIGQKLSAKIDVDQPWRTTLRGGNILVLSFLLPILGWFIIFPFSLIIGCGAMTLSFFNFKRTAVAPAAFQPSFSGAPLGTNAQTANLNVGAVVGVQQ
ncbi:MAG: hypothetical protein ABI954_12550 [Pyrinomonadaceae bacterium]